MPELEPDHVGPSLDTLGDALRDLHKLNVLVAYVPDLSNRANHLEALQEGIEGLSAVIPDLDTLDPPEEGS